MKANMLWIFTISLLIISQIEAISSSTYQVDRSNCKAEVNNYCMLEAYELPVRSVNCITGEKSYVCCGDLDLSAAVEFTGKRWIASVDKAATKIGSRCTKLIICTLSCRNAWKVRGRARFDENAPDSKPIRWDFVGAFMLGERLSCYGRTWTDKNDDMYSKHMSSCVTGCNEEFSVCQVYRDALHLTGYYLETSKIFNQLGMWFFTAADLARQRVEETASKSNPTGFVVENAFQILHDRMMDLDSFFRDWVKIEILLNTDNHALCRYILRDRKQATLSACWNGFLERYNGTDQDLVENIYESMDYSEYRNAMIDIQIALKTFDFSSIEWAHSDGEQVRFAASQLVLFSFVNILCTALTAHY